MKLHKNRIVTFLNFHGFYKNEIKNCCFSPMNLQGSVLEDKFGHKWK